tara:strand:+ start:34047 stop:34955 length:909 start_codon:yes stop_codon:yes gene_type:complete
MKEINLIGAPSDYGASKQGARMGPNGLRVAGIKNSLETLGLSVKDLGDVSGPSTDWQLVKNGYRHLSEVSEWCQSLSKQVHESLSQNGFPLIMGGDHSLAIGSIAGVHHYCQMVDKDLHVVWIDAHADYNTATSSLSGNLHGMPVAVLTGEGPSDLTDLGDKTPLLNQYDITQIGIRSVDKSEKTRLTESRLKVCDMGYIDQQGMAKAIKEFIEPLKKDNTHIHVSFDVDAMDDTLVPGTGTPEPGGLTYREARQLFEALHQTGCIGSLDIYEVNPALDHKNKTSELAVDLITYLMGRKLVE